MDFFFDSAIAEAAPGLEVIVVEAAISNPPTSEALWREIEDECARIKSSYAIEEIRHRPGIAGTRDAYKALGKEPNRYRPSTEALCRRAVKGMELYRTLTAIDLINLLSMRSGYSIGGFDADKISGNALTLGVGRHEEPYEGIGRGLLNIEAMPVVRDSLGGIGTPTSDNERTKLSPDTRRLLMTVHIYRPEMEVAEFKALAERLLRSYAKAEDVTFSHYRP